MRAAKRWLAVAAAHAQSSARRARSTGARAAGARPRRRRSPGVRPHWDRLARVALVVVMLGVLALYVGPAISYVGAWRESHARQAEVARLQADNARLRAQKRTLADPATLERRARALGMVRRGERSFVVTGLPSG